MSSQQNFVAATSRKKSNQTESVRLVAATNSVAATKIFTKILWYTRSDVSLQRVAATCCCNLSPSVYRPYEYERKNLCENDENQFYAVTSEVDLDEVLKRLGERLDSQADDVDATTTSCMTKEQQQYQRNIATEHEEGTTQAGIDELKVAHSGSKSGTPNAGVSVTEEKDEIPATITAGEPAVSTVKKNGYLNEGT